MIPFRQLQWIAVALFAAASPGCLILPYGFPTIAHIDEVSIPSPGDDVQVFRVDGNMRWRERPLNFPAVEEVVRLTRIDRVDAGTIDAQWNVGIEHGWFAVGLANAIVARRHSTVAVLLYHPGYETICITAEDRPHFLEWTPISDVAGQEQAVDMLLLGAGSQFSTWYFTGSARQDERLGGDFSAAHREALLFCAAEYERIAALAAADRSPRAPEDEWRAQLAGLAGPAGFDSTRGTDSETTEITGARLAKPAADDKTLAEELHERLLAKAKVLRRLATE